MCSPALLKGELSLAVPEDLRHHVLLHFDWPAQEQVTPDWGTWLRSTEVKGVDATRGPRFTQPDYAMQAAVEGAGVVLGWRSLARADLDSGRLTIPFDLPLPMDVAFYFVYPEVSAELPKLARFREWLLSLTVASREVRPRPASGRGRRKGRASPLKGGRARSGV